MANILAIETSSSQLSVAVFAGKGQILQKKIHGFQNHLEKLLPAIDTLLRKKKLLIHKIGVFLIGRGPGSFTGLRVGFGTLKGFLSAQPQKCYGALSLDLAAENVGLPEKSWLCIGLDAYRGKIYSRLYQRSKNRWVPKTSPETLSFQDWASQLPVEIYLAGNACERYATEIKSIPAKKINCLPIAQGYPEAGKLIKLFLKDPKKIQALEKPRDFVPLYFRLSEAEERMNEKSKELDSRSCGNDKRTHVPAC